MKIKEANKTKGCIFIDLFGTVTFRVYDKKGEFIDYNLKQSDLFITIDDKDAYFYTNDKGETWLDHSPETLGYIK